MAILLRNLAKVNLPAQHRLEVLKLYCHENRQGDVVQNYVYHQGTAYLPLNKTKLDYVSQLLGEEIVDERAPGELLKDPFVMRKEFTLRIHQEVPAPALLGYVKTHRYAVLKAGCSLGKTCVMTWVAGHLGKKVLVLVDQGNLAGQWQDAFQMVWGKSSSILKSREDLSNDVVIATFQFLHRHPELVSEMKEMFGVCLCDEMHISAAKTYRAVLFKLSNMYRIGTTATLMRKGFSNEVLTDLISDVSVEMTDDNALIPEIRFVTTGVKFFSNDPNVFTKTLTELSQNDARNDLIVELIKQEVGNGRKILLVGSRIDSLTYLHKRCSEFCNAALYVGSTTLKQDRALKEDMETGKTQVILADKKIEKGTDLPSLDTVIIAKPMNNEATVTQVVGRIVRPLAGKPLPVVYDLVDTGALAWRFAANRHGWYSELNYKFDKPTYFFLDNF